MASKETIDYYSNDTFVHFFSGSTAVVDATSQ